MPALLGTVPKYGIDKAESGVLIEGLDFDGQPEIYEQKNEKGKKNGLLIIDEQIGFTMTGAIPSTGAAALKVGASLALANTIPDIWGTTPTGTTVFLSGVKHSLKNTDAQKIDVSGTVYGFGATTTGNT